MSNDAAAPEGISLAEFKSVSLEAGSWIWGTLQGAFNEKQSVSQIIVDAIIGMIPLVGDATAIRDLIAVVIGLVQDPRKREDKFQWVLLVVLICALIPVFGGAIKGVGRMLIHVMGEVAQIAEKSARAAKLLEAARDMVALCNRLGVGNAEKWLKELKFAKYQDEIMRHINEVLTRLDSVLDAILSKISRVSWAVPSVIKEKVTALKDGIAAIKRIISDHIPAAIKQLDNDLRELQQLIHSGGESTSRATSRAATAGAKNSSHVEELILLEGKGAVRTARGGFKRNGITAAEADRWYKHEPGYPDLKSFSPPNPGSPEAIFPRIGTYAGDIVNREIEPGERIFRIFGPGDKTYGVDVGQAYAMGDPRFVGKPAFFGLGEAPADAERWRHGSAVLDEWNRDKFIITGEVLPGNSPLMGCTGIIAEQQGQKIGVQYLEGGDKQAMLVIPPAVANRLNELGEMVQKSGQPMTETLGGIKWELRPTGWEDANGIHGYVETPGPGTVQTVHLGDSEIASKQKPGGSN